MPSLETPSRIDELDAVNLMLRNAGEDPVTSIGPDSKPTALKAKEMLAEESIRVQSEGYNFCTDRALELVPTTSGEILLPSNILSFHPVGRSAHLDLQEDSTRLYNATTNSHKFDQPVTVHAVLAKPFKNLPQPARWLIAVSASLRFLNSENPGGAGLRFTSSDLENAKAALERYDKRLRKGGLRAHNPHIRRLRGNR